MRAHCACRNCVLPCVIHHNRTLTVGANVHRAIKRRATRADNLAINPTHTSCILSTACLPLRSSLQLQCCFTHLSVTSRVLSNASAVLSLCLQRKVHSFSTSCKKSVIARFMQYKMCGIIINLHLWVWNRGWTCCCLPSRYDVKLNLPFDQLRHGIWRHKV